MHSCVSLDTTNENIVVWNPCGLNALSRGYAVWDVIADSGASIACLVESKLATVDIFTVAKVLGQQLDQYVFLPATNMAGGIVVAWQSSRVSVTRTQVDSYSVSLQLSYIGGVPWALTVVYGPTVDSRKLEFLEELRQVRTAFPGPWAVAGDFNLILEAADKNNDRINRRMMGRFRRLLNDLELKEQDLVGRRYTWSNERRTPTLVKLDRWFCSVDWELSFPDCLL